MYIQTTTVSMADRRCKEEDGQEVEDENHRGRSFSQSGVNRFAGIVGLLENDGYLESLSFTFGDIFRAIEVKF